MTLATPLNDPFCLLFSSFLSDGHGLTLEGVVYMRGLSLFQDIFGFVWPACLFWSACIMTVTCDCCLYPVLRVSQLGQGCSWPLCLTELNKLKGL